jgi:tRNA (mo5U34)-methyltransferase
MGGVLDGLGGRPRPSSNFSNVSHDGAEGDLEHRVASRQWYHTLELSSGVVTPGWFDLRSFAANHFPWPDLVGKRCLDIGTFDGFWAFEMEKRGAKEVVAVDVLDPLRWDWPVKASDETIREIARRHEGGAGFDLAKAALGSGVERLDVSVYDLGSSELGTFDYVFLGSLLVHLKSPVAALEQVGRICGPDARFIVIDAIDYELTVLMRSRPVARFDGVGRPWWWKPNLASLAAMVSSAGFTIVDVPRTVFLRPGPGFQHGSTSWRSLRTHAGREATVIRRRGDPHGLLVTQPS